MTSRFVFGGWLLLLCKFERSSVTAQYLQQLYAADASLAAAPSSSSSAEGEEQPATWTSSRPAQLQGQERNHMLRRVVASTTIRDVEGNAAPHLPAAYRTGIGGGSSDSESSPDDYGSASGMSTKTEIMQTTSSDVDLQLRREEDERSKRQRTFYSAVMSGYPRRGTTSAQFVAASVLQQELTQQLQPAKKSGAGAKKKNTPKGKGGKNNKKGNGAKTPKPTSATEVGQDGDQAPVRWSSMAFCPGSPATPDRTIATLVTRVWCGQLVSGVKKTDCKAVLAEMRARVTGKNNWQDPEQGKYSEVTEQASRAPWPPPPPGAKGADNKNSKDKKGAKKGADKKGAKKKPGGAKGGKKKSASTSSASAASSLAELLIQDEQEGAASSSSLVSVSPDESDEVALGLATPTSPSIGTSLAELTKEVTQNTLEVDCVKTDPKSKAPAKDRARIFVEQEPSGDCVAYGCTESQVATKADAGKTYCAVHNLLCSGQENCKMAGGAPDWVTKEVLVEYTAAGGSVQVAGCGKGRPPASGPLVERQSDGIHWMVIGAGGLAEEKKSSCCSCAVICGVIFLLLILAAIAGQMYLANQKQDDKPPAPDDDNDVTVYSPLEASGVRVFFLKQPGDVVTKDDIVVQILAPGRKSGEEEEGDADGGDEAEAVRTDIASPIDGKLGRLLVPEDTEIDVDTATGLCTIQGHSEIDAEHAVSVFSPITCAQASVEFLKQVGDVVELDETIAVLSVVKLRNEAGDRTGGAEDGEEEDQDEEEPTAGLEEGAEVDVKSPLAGEMAAVLVQGSDGFKMVRDITELCQVAPKDGVVPAGGGEDGEGGEEEEGADEEDVVEPPEEGADAGEEDPEADDDAGADDDADGAEDGDGDGDADED